MDPAVTVTGFDHLVLRCADVEVTLSWYVDALGLEPVRVDAWRAGAVPFPSVRVDEGTIIDLVRARGGDDVPVADGRLDHLCLVVAATDLDELARSGRFEVLDGPAERFGARGQGRSLYVRDPDGTTVELRWYP